MSGSGRRRGLQDEEEEHENHERWLVTYADMVTLLMVLFIVMFAMSQVDQRKFMALKNGLAAGFANSDSVLPGANSILNEPGSQPVPPVAPDQDVAGSSLSVSTPVGRDARTRKQAADEAERLRKILEKVVAEVAAKGLADDVRTSIDERGVVISLVSRHVVFQADLAVLSPRGEAVVDTLGPVLRELDEDLEISGHTNQVAVQPKFYATDWDLSAARAVTVLRRLDEQLGLPEDRLSLAAYGDTRPLEDPTRPGSQQVNKRVDIVVLSPSDPETRAAMGELLDGTHTPTTPTPETGQADPAHPASASDDLAAHSESTPGGTTS